MNHDIASRRLASHRATRALLVAATLAVAATHPSSALALEKCKGKINPKDGVILISAKGVAGTLQWGNTAAQTTNNFANSATCLDGDKATKCELGSPGSAQQVTPPELCTVFLEDGLGATCSAFLKGCTPGLRTVGSGFVAKSGDVMSGTLRAFSLDTAFGVPGCGAGDVCAFSRLISQLDTQVGGTLELGGSVHQGATSAGIVKGGLVVECDNSPTITRFFNTTATGPFTATGGGITNPGQCVITAPFALNNRFVVATGINNSVVGMDEVVATVEHVSTNAIRIKRSIETSGVMTGNNGPVSILIY